jgi:hypothetical protein
MTCRDELAPFRGPRPDPGGDGRDERLLREARAGCLWEDEGPPERTRRPLPPAMRDLPRAHARLRPGARAADVLNELGPADRAFRFPDDEPLDGVWGYQRGRWRLVVWLDRDGLVRATELLPRPVPAWLQERVAALSWPQQALFHELFRGGGFEAASRAYRAATGEDID